MRTRKRRRFAAIGASVALLATACGGDGDNGSEGDQDVGASRGGSFTVDLSEPEQLAPSPYVYESEGSQVWSLIGEPMVEVNPESGDVEYTGFLESIETEDNTVFTLHLKDGYTFHHSGEPADADALIRGWNFAQSKKAATDTAGFLAKVAGAGEGAEAEGLEKVDDLTVEVTLSAPFAEFPKMLGFMTAYQPQSEWCLANQEECNDQPDGVGPYMFEGTWRHNQGITVVRNEDYPGDRAANADQIELVIQPDLTAAFRDFQAGRLDLLTSIEPEVYEEAEAQYGDQIIQEEAPSFTFLSFPMWDPYYKDPKMRQAFSLAIDRQQIIDEVLNGLYTPSTDFVPPAVPGHRDDACEFCTFEPDRAQQLFAEAGGQEGDTVNLWFNSGSGHETWVEAVGRQLASNLGIEFELKSMEWDQYTGFIEEQGFDGPFRLGWLVDYPSPENFLRPLIDSDGDANYGGYANPRVDKLMADADRQPTADEAYEAYYEAGDVALEELPLIPLWDGKTTIIPSDKVDNIIYNTAKGQIELGEVVVAAP